MRKKILVVFGTRPEAIKMAPLVHELLKHSDTFETKVCVTAQHREMLDQVLSIFKIKPDYDLNLMKPKQDLFDITSQVLTGMKPVLTEFKPDLVMVHGDTSTSLATALAAFYLQIPVAHVEAGLRTYNNYSPWPEEINRQLCDRICTYHFTPTNLNAENLANERVAVNHIVITGNTVIDALKMVVSNIESNTAMQTTISKTLLKKGYDTSKLNDRKLILVTGHRRENFGQSFINICEALKAIALDYPDVDIVYPVHLNPQVQKPVYDILNDTKNIFLIEPLEYLPFVYLMSKSYFIITDSGGIQEEAPGLGKPVLVMRDTTERPEGLKAGTVKLVGTSRENIIKETKALLNSKKNYNLMAKAKNPYGNGEASRIIVEYLLKTLM